MPPLFRLQATAVRLRVIRLGAPFATSNRAVGVAGSRPRRNAATSASGFFPSHLRLQARGKKTKTTVSFDALPQGPLPALGDAADGVLPEQDSGPAYPTVVMQARRNMNKYDNCVLLTRVGGFYELYFEHAEEYGPLLNLKVAQKKTGAGPVPMVI
jgi:hypothetical protein